jgi:hypothetical protein
MAVVCLTYYQWRCTQTPGCCCLECQMVERYVCWTVNSGGGGSDCPNPTPACASDGCPGDYSWCGDDTGGGGGGSTDMVWIRNNQLGAFENRLLSSNALFHAVQRFILNTGDYTLYSQVVADALLHESDNTVLVSYFTYLADNGTYLSALQQAQWPTIGTQEWAEITENNIVAPPAAVTFQGFSSQELGRFLVIPEDVTSTSLYVPSNATEGNVDGFFSSGWTDNNYWFKISKGGRATVRKTSTGFDIINIVEDRFWRSVARLGNRFYCICWQDINQPRPINNPLPR